MSGRYLAADARFADRHNRMAERHDIDAKLEHALCDGGGFFGVAEHDRDDWVLAGKNRELGAGHGVAEELRVLRQLFSQIVGVGEINRGQGCAGDGGGNGVAEEVWAAALAEEIDHFAAAADVTAAGSAEGFAEGAGEDVDAISEVVMFGRAAAACAE